MEATDPLVMLVLGVVSALTGVITLSIRSMLRQFTEVVRQYSRSYDEVSESVNAVNKRLAELAELLKEFMAETRKSQESTLAGISKIENGVNSLKVQAQGISQRVETMDTEIRELTRVVSSLEATIRAHAEASKKLAEVLARLESKL